MTVTNKISVFCENLRRLRKEANLTKKEMARKLGISVYLLSQIEKGKVSNRITVNLILRVYSEFKILPSELFESSK